MPALHTYAIPAALLALLGIHAAHRTRGAANASWDTPGPAMRPWYEYLSGGRRHIRPNPAALYALISARRQIRYRARAAARPNPAALYALISARRQITEWTNAGRLPGP